MSTTECSDLGEEFWLPEEFLDDDFFSEEEKAAVAARSESDEEDSLAGLSRRLEGLLGDDGGRKPPTAAKAEVTVGSPQSTLCGLPKSGQESPNDGASKGTSPPSSPLEQKPADPWELLYEAAGQVARMRAASSMPVQANNAYGFNAQSGFAPPARKPSPPPIAPPSAKVPVAGAHYHPFAHLVSQRQMQAAQGFPNAHSWRAAPVCHVTVARPCHIVGGSAGLQSSLQKQRRLRLTKAPSSN